MARSIWGNHVLRECFATELGEPLAEDQLILQTAITQNVKSQKGKGAELHTKNVEELSLGFVRFLHIYYAFQRLVCSGAYLLTKNQSCLQSLLRAFAYGTSVSGTAWLLFTVFLHFNFFHYLYLLVYLFSPVIKCFSLQVNFLAWLLYLNHRGFAKKPRNWICAEEVGEDVVTANSSPSLSKTYQNKWGMFMLCEYLLTTWRQNFALCYFALDSFNSSPDFWPPPNNENPVFTEIFVKFGLSIASFRAIFEAWSGDCCVHGDVDLWFCLAEVQAAWRLFCNIPAERDVSLREKAAMQGSLCSRSRAHGGCRKVLWERHQLSGGCWAGSPSSRARVWVAV